MVNCVHVVKTPWSNIASVTRMLNAIGVKWTYYDLDSLPPVECIIFPGNGNMSQIFQCPALIELIKKIRIKNYFEKYIGICLGMQILTDGSEEFPEMKIGGVINGRCISLGTTILGERIIYHDNGSAGLGNRIAGKFYFNHSYALPSDSDINGGFDRFVSEDRSYISMLIDDKFLLTQFHPEISGPAGYELVGKFLE